MQTVGVQPGIGGGTTTGGFHGGGSFGGGGITIGGGGGNSAATRATPTVNARGVPQPGSTGAAAAADANTPAATVTARRRVTISTNPTATADGSPHAEPVQRLSDLSERALSELEQHIAGLPVDANRISGTLGLAGVTGQVNSAGTAVAGTGFTPSRTSAGIFVITFSPAFAAAPTVVAGVFNTTVARYIFVTAVTTTTATINIRTGAAALVDEAFHFVAFATV